MTKRNRWVRRLAATWFIGCAALCAAPHAAETGPESESDGYITYASVLVVDLTGDGIHTVGRGNGTHFDFDDDRRAELTTWPARTMAILVLDRNSDGKIDHGAELFGSFTPFASAVGASDAFAALAQFDSDQDGRITPKDAIYDRLGLWIGGSESSVGRGRELMTLSQARVEAIHLNWSSVRTVDAAGSVVRRIATARIAGRDRAVAELWLAIHVGATIERETTPLPPAIANLPHARGHGMVRDLRPAMAGNATLQSLMERYVSARSVAERDGMLDAIIWEWAEASRVDPTSRGPHIDARYLVAFERFVGMMFRGTGGRRVPTLATHDPEDMKFGSDRPNSPTQPTQVRRFTGDEERLLGTPDPSPKSAEILMMQYAGLRAFVRAQLLAQTAYKEDFALEVDGSTHVRARAIEPTHFVRRLGQLAAQGDRLIELYCIGAAFDLLDGYHEVNADDLAWKAGARTIIDGRLAQVKQIQAGWRSDDTRYSNRSGLSTLGCVDLLRFRREMEPARFEPSWRARIEAYRSGSVMDGAALGLLALAGGLLLALLALRWTRRTS